MKQRLRWYLACGIALGVGLIVTLTSEKTVMEAGQGFGTTVDTKKQAALLDLLTTFRREFVEITPGKDKFPAKFVMGNADGPAAEQPPHEVTFVYSFYMAKYEVPQNLYEAIMGNNPSRWKGRRNSAEMFTWADAREFCGKATQLLRENKLIAADEEVRLPTEAEWEYCCRAGTTTAFSFGDKATVPGDSGNKASLLAPYAWHTGNAAGNDPEVGKLKPNPWGLYDMHGYLAEFVSDAWHENYQGAPTDGSSRSSKEQQPPRVLRGGSWKDRHELHRSSARRPVSVMARDDGIGFRCVLAKSDGREFR